ncbi:hypothetical protein [Sphingobium sp.]|uniref:hypothetical protein n=1 Tax=Sphingobium sp. TaxID=1912891 RepID=UPI003B3B1686
MIGLCPPAAAQTEYPDVPEPMIFDMMRPLGAKRGEMEANTLATVPLSGSDKTVNWAPEIEYALTDGFAIEGELPFEDGRLVELKLGLQAAFGTLNGGRTAHGVQYLGIYDRHARDYRNSFAYMVAHRYNDRWSSVTMAGLGDIAFSGGRGRNAAIVNHSLFYDSADGQVLGLEINYRGGADGYVLAMPQIHQRLAHKVNVQAGIGAERPHGNVFRPKAGIRLIREF